MFAAHALAEEDIIYPMLRDDAQRQEMASRLYREHAEMRGIIERHPRQDGDSEFLRLRAALSGDRKSRLLSEIHREEALLL